MVFSRIFTEYGLNGVANEFSDESEKSQQKQQPQQAHHKQQTR